MNNANVNLLPTLDFVGKALNDMTMASAARARFTELISLPDEALNLAEAALLIAAETEPALDVAGYLERLDSLAQQARPLVLAHRGASERIARLNQFLFVEKGFVGNRESYYDPRNSLLNHVLDRRTGIPITLSVIYIEVAQRLGLPVRGIGFPGHFLIKHVGEPEIIIDAYFGQILSEDDCQERLRAVLGRRATFNRSYLKTATAKEILSRMLANLKQIYVKANDLTAALGCVDRMLLLSPDSPREVRDRGLIYEQLECYGAAVVDLERFLQLAPDDDSVDVVRATLVNLKRQVAHIH
jgi:regulator of sirC expression with transglutaminase-like and TPR domain